VTYFGTCALLKLIREDAQSQPLGAFIDAQPAPRWFSSETYDKRLAAAAQEAGLPVLSPA
jgi:hypothetical protein